MSFSDIGPGDYTRRVEESAKQAKKSDTKLSDFPLDLDTIGDIFENLDCQDRSQLCQTNRSFASFCRTESHKKKCNPESEEAKVLRSKIKAISEKIRIDVDAHTSFSGFTLSEGRITISDIQKFASFLNNDDMWNYLEELQKMGSLVYGLNDQNHELDIARQVSYRNQRNGASRFRAILPRLSELKLGKMGVKNFSYIIDNILSTRITLLKFFNISDGMSPHMWRKNGQLGRAFQSIQSMKFLQTLHLTHTNIGNSIGDAVASMLFLEDLNLKGNDITNIDLSALRRLTYLRLSNNSLKEINVSSQQNLKALHLDHNELTTIDLRQNTKLRRLQMENNLLTNIILPPKLEEELFQSPHGTSPIIFSKNSSELLENLRFRKR